MAMVSGCEVLEVRGDQALALKKSGAMRSLATAVESVDSAAGRKRVREYLDQQPFPHFKPSTESPGRFIKIDEDGSRTVGRFKNRKFIAVK